MEFPSDEDLIKNVGEGDHNSFEELRERHRPRLAGLIRRLLPPSCKGADCQKDVEQHVWMNIYFGAATFEQDVGTFIPWSKRVSLNEVRQHLKRWHKWGMRMVPFSGHEKNGSEPSFEPSLASAPAQETADQMRDANKYFLRLEHHLSSSDFHIYFERMVNKTPHAEIADDLQLTEGYVKVRLHEIKGRIRKLAETDEVIGQFHSDDH